MVIMERSDGFFEGMNTRTEQTGLFPAEYVKPKVTHLANTDFNSGVSTEVVLKKGDPIMVTMFRDDGWLRGQNLRTSEVGLIPSSFVSKAPE